MRERKSRGSLFVVSAPSGTGKTTLCRKLVSSLPDLKFSVSYTTRRQRPGEISDKDYTFVGKDEFLSMVGKGEFIEWAEVHGAFYGTSRKRIESIMNAGSDVILDIDTQGAMQIKEKYVRGAYIFILPPSMEILRQRLEKRMTDSREEIDKRLKTALVEIKTYSKYDYVIINDVFEKALKEFEAIIIAHRVGTKTINQLWVRDSFLKREEH